MDGLDLAGVQNVAREEGDDEQDDEDGQGPRCEDLLLARLGLVCVGALARLAGCGRGLTIGVCIDCVSLCGKSRSARVLCRAANIRLEVRHTEQLGNDCPPHCRRHAGVRVWLASAGVCRQKGVRRGCAVGAS